MIVEYIYIEREAYFTDGAIWKKLTNIFQNRRSQIISILHCLHKHFCRVQCRLYNRKSWDVKFVAIQFLMSVGRRAMKLQDVLKTNMFVTYLTVVYCLQDSYPVTGTWTDYCSKMPSHNGTFPPLYNNPGIALYYTSLIEYRSAVEPKWMLQLKDQHLFQIPTKCATHGYGERKGEALLPLPRATSIPVASARGRDARDPENEVGARPSTWTS